MIKEIQDMVPYIHGKKYRNKKQQLISQKQKNRNYSPIRIMGRRVNTDLTTIWICKAINRVQFFCKNNKEERKEEKKILNTSEYPNSV